MRIVYSDMDCTLHPGCYPLEDSYLYPDQSRDVKAEAPEVVAEMERLYAEWWHGWCAGPNAVVDPMHTQITEFSYFPPARVFQRLEHLGRDDQIQDLRRRLEVRRRQMPPPFPASRY